MAGQDFLYVVPQHIDLKAGKKTVILYFRSREVRENMRVIIRSGENVLYSKRYIKLKPPEMERVRLNLKGDLPSGVIDLIMEPVKD